jgi:hypothetical protein
VKYLFPARLLVAVVALAAFPFPASVLAQTQPQQQSVESANLILPEAPGYQSASPATPQTTKQPEASATPAPSSSSQQTTPPATPATPPATATPQTAEEKHAEAERELKVQEKQRLLGVMPQFQVVMGGPVVPLTPGEKWRLALKSAIDPFYIGWAFVIGGGYGELVNSSTQQGYGWGPAGYFKRVGSNYADNVNGALIGNALLPSILHQDPRYFRKGTGSIKSRFLYAALSTVICHGDNGKKQFNTSNVLGNYISGAISNAYYPADQRGVYLTLKNGTDVTLFGALGGQILEFGPDLARLVSKKKHPAPPSTAPGAAAPPTATPATTAPNPASKP